MKSFSWKISIISQVNKLILSLFILLLFDSCSGKIEIGLNKIMKAHTTVTLVTNEGEIHQVLTFDSSDESNFLSYGIDCTYQASSGAAAIPCANYGTHSPNVDSVNKEFKWEVDSTTPNGIYHFTIKKIYTDKEYAVS